MCLAIYKPAGTEIPTKHLTNGFENHSDGAGMAWAVDGVLHVRKGMFKIEEVLEQYELIKQYPALIHFRKATHGKVDAANCHPFVFNDNKLALIHNGVLPIKCSIDGLSDTAHFVKLVLEPLVKFHKLPINDGALNYLICTSIGTDKMAVMDGEGKTYIFNEDKGTWDGGAWYSNTSFRYCYSYSKSSSATTASGEDWKTHPYFANKTGAGATSGTGATDYKHSNWRKHWQDSEEGDDSYIEFWKRTGVNCNTSQGCGQSDPTKTQKLPKLLTEGSGDTVDDSGNVITVEEDAPKFSEGEMCEYGWFDEEVEAEVKRYQDSIGLTREDALIRVFNERG